ncbi:MAG: hypothetical protein MUP90_07105 [Gammaproteobacteria bacterium]|nr:hypothetical protein [Gammaproteobacteria bacterium]
MITQLLAALFVIGSLAAGAVPAFAAEPDVLPKEVQREEVSHQNVLSQEVQLSPDLLALLRAEMVEITGGMQGITYYLASADWHSIQETSEKIRDSYIMNMKLSAAQGEELEQALPERFKQLDAEFHHRAGKLGAAAAAHDAELVVFQYSRLLETCTVCHAAYAGSRFPGFGSDVLTEHAH